MHTALPEEMRGAARGVCFKSAPIAYTEERAACQRFGVAAHDMYLRAAQSDRGGARRECIERALALRVQETAAWRALREPQEVMAIAAVLAAGTYWYELGDLRRMFECVAEAYASPDGGPTVHELAEFNLKNIAALVVVPRIASRRPRWVWAVPLSGPDVAMMRDVLALVQFEQRQSAASA